MFGAHVHVMCLLHSLVEVNKSMFFSRIAGGQGQGKLQRTFMASEDITTARNQLPKTSLVGNNQIREIGKYTMLWWEEALKTFKTGL